MQKVSDRSISGDNVIGAVIAIAQMAEEAMGGTSGALYSFACLALLRSTFDSHFRIFFSALAQGLQVQDTDILTGTVWTTALVSALDKLYTYTRARPPSRTLIDPLAAFVEALQNGSDLKGAIKVAGDAAEGTKDIEAKAGRSAYVEGKHLKEQKVPDPGAWGCKIILDNLL